MAQLTEVEKRQLQAKGTWVREKCDRVGCGNPLGFLSWKGKSGAYYCSEACMRAEIGQEVRVYKSARSHVPDNAQHVRGAYVEGYDSIELAILKRMAKESEEPWNAGSVIELLYSQGVGARPHIRQAIWNLLVQGKIMKEKRVLKISTNGSKLHDSHSKPKKGQRTSETHSNKQETARQQGVRPAKPAVSKRLHVRDAPAAE
jgi:hypothetical protein